MGKDKIRPSTKEAWTGIPRAFTKRDPKLRIQTAVVLWEEEVTKLIAVCKKHGCSKSEAIRIAINAYTV